MLQYHTVDKPTLELLKQLQQTAMFNELRLVGGTSLALQIGHRTSIDIDLFGIIDADELEINKFKEYSYLFAKQCESRYCKLHLSLVGCTHKA